MTLVSVVVPSYNHEAFVAETIGSVLAQTYDELELIVVDDHSTDGSCTVINSIADRRLRRIYLPQNGGGSAALNVGIRAATGTYVAICNSDDAWQPDKLRRQVEILDAHPEIAAVFTDVEWIDAAGKPLDAQYEWLTRTFTTPNRSSGKWMRQMIEWGNCLCHPSILIRRTIYDEIGLYSSWLKQLPDLEMWLRLLQRHSIFVMGDRLVRYRWHMGNTSRPARETSRRSINEFRLIVRHFFDHINAPTFGATFGWLSELEGEALTWEKALYLMGYKGLYENMFKQLGWEYAVEMLLPEPGRLPAFVAERLDPAAFQQQLSIYSPWLRTWMSEASPVALGNLGVVGTARNVLLAVARRIKRRLRL